jgi:hypothetical protein
MKYYTHQDTGYYDSYFGNVGRPIETSHALYCCARALGYITTKAKDTDSIGAVHVKAQIASGSHPNSYKVEQLKKAYQVKKKGGTPEA